MPRRIPDYPDSFAGWNYVSSMGSIISVIATALFLYIIYGAYTEESDQIVERNPWSISSFFVTTKEIEDATLCATTLEFSVISPTPTHAYDVLPILTDTNDSIGSRALV
jgi:cytochrome c oxidase subunit 1